MLFIKEMVNINIHINFEHFFPDKLEAWNKPRDVKLPATALYDIDFQRNKHGKERKEKRELKGARPESYHLHEICTVTNKPLILS